MSTTAIRQILHGFRPIRNDFYKRIIKAFPDKAKKFFGKNYSPQEIELFEKKCTAVPKSERTQLLFRYLRMKHGDTQKSLADKLSCNSKTIAKFESGERSLTNDTLASLQKVYPEATRELFNAPVNIDLLRKYIVEKNAGTTLIIRSK